MIRRAGQPPHSGQKYRPRPGAYALLPLDRGILLTAETGNGYDIQLPGGGIEQGESPLQALHREVLEETGWRISRPRRLGAFRRFVFMPEYDLWAEKICHIYLARPAYQRAAPSEPHHETLVLDPDIAVSALGNAGDRIFLSNYLAGAYS